MIMGSTRRIIFAIVGSNLLYALLIINFGIFEELLGIYAYKISNNLYNIYNGILLISILGVILAIFVPSHQSLVGFFSHISFAILFIPLCAIYTLSGGSFAFPFFCGLAFAFSFIIFGRSSIVSVNLRSHFDIYIVSIFLMYLFLVLIYLAINGGLRFTFVSFRDVYDLRLGAQFGETLVANRFVTISAYIATSYIIVYSIIYRNIVFFIIGSMNSYILYCSFGFKLFLFFTPIIVFLYIFYNMKNPYLLLFFISSVMIVISITIYLDISYLYSIVNFINDVIIRRYLYGPGYISYAWYDTFVENPYVYLSNFPIIRNFIDYPYDISYSSIVALNIFNVDFNPNTSVIGYGFANFGYIGILIYVIFVYILLKIIDKIAYNLQSSYIGLGAVAPATLFLEADPLVTLISFGFGIIVLGSILLQIISTHYHRLKSMNL